MITLERTFDYALVASVMRHPRLYPWIADDCYPTPEFFWPMENEAIRYLLAKDGERTLGLCITHPINQRLWEVHHAILPAAWGARALAIGEAFMNWIWEHTAAARIVGFTPADNRLAIRYARTLGMCEDGRLAACYPRAGQLHDLLILSKSR